jgi:hypothetical protein
LRLPLPLPVLTKLNLNRVILTLSGSNWGRTQHLLLPFFFQTSKKTSSRPKAAHFAAVVERSLYFAFVFAVAIVCFRRHPERSEGSPHLSLLLPSTNRRHPIYKPNTAIRISDTPSNHHKHAL